MLGRIRALVIKEIAAVFQDRKIRTVLVLPPLLQLFVFTFAATLDVKNVSIGILNHDAGAQSFELIQRVKGSPTFTRVHHYEGEKELRDAINNQKVLVGLSIDERFSRNLLKGEPALAQVIVDGRKLNSGQIAGGYLTEIINQYNIDLGRGAHIELLNRNWFNPNLIYPWFTLTGLVGILTMLTSLSVTGHSVARERELNTFDQLLVTPLTPMEILLGKSLPAIGIGMVEGTIMLIAGTLLIRLPFQGSILYLYAGMFVFVLAIVGVGLFISSISRTQQQAMLGIFLFMVPAVILSGYATRVLNMPKWLQFFTMFDPLKYFIIIVRGTTMKNIGFGTLVSNIWPMALIALFTLATSSYFFRLGLRR